MADSRKKAKIPRQKMPERDPAERRRDFREVPLGFSEELAVKEASRCLQCEKPQCVLGCPVDIDIVGFIERIAARDFPGAARTMKQANILPAICGRVCPQEDQCEKHCALGLKGEPVAIGRLERFVGDWERSRGEAEMPACAEPTGKKIAVVGSGPAGLTVAFELARRGHAVTIFEAFHKPGGVLVYGIPEFRLPKAIVQAEIDGLKKMGVEFHYNYVIGRLRTVQELLEQYDTVFLGTGAGLPLFLNIPGENLNGVYSANEYLTRSNLMKAYEFPQSDTPIMRSRKVAVIGGGNVTMDSARTALRLGAEHVYIVYRRSEIEMPARNEEIEHGREEGIEFHFLTNPVQILGDAEGWVTGMECLRMRLGEPDESGRRRPIPIEGSEYVIEVDTVIVAIGNRPNPLVPSTQPEIDTGRWGNIVADDAGRTSMPGVFAAGDIVTGSATVIEAMGSGRQVANAMHDYVMNDGPWPKADE